MPHRNKQTRLKKMVRLLLKVHGPVEADKRTTVQRPTSKISKTKVQAATSRTSKKVASHEDFIADQFSMAFEVRPGAKISQKDLGKIEKKEKTDLQILIDKEIQETAKSSKTAQPRKRAAR